MAADFQWKRFWCRREGAFTLADRGFLADPEGEHGTILNPDLTTLDQLQPIGCLALLGEPGIGKSWSLTADINAFVEQSPALKVISLNLRSYGSEDRLYRALFENPDFLEWVRGEHELHVYLDSFDECLLRTEAVAGLLADQLPHYPLVRLKLRIACRTAAWPAVLENALKRGYGTDSFAAIELAPLRRKDVLEAAAASGIKGPTAFLARVDALQLAPLAGKPITLKMLLQTFKREGDLATNLMSLYEKSCLILCEEQNEHRRVSGLKGKLSAATRLEIASRIAAVTQFGNHFAVWTGTEAAAVPVEDVSVAQLVGGTETAEHSVDVTSDAVLETLDSGLFSSRGEERLGWSHQTFAEYLAARFCLVHGLSIEQLRSLVFHPRRARVIPQVREGASWLALQNEELFKEIAEKDPEVLLGSGAASLTFEQRRVLTEALLRTCDEDEILHANHNLALRHLDHPDLAEQLRPVLLDRNRSWATRYFAVQILRDCAVGSLGDDLLNIALSEDEGHELRTIAAYALADTGSGSERGRMRPLLTTRREVDPNDQLRGATLSAVYPGATYDDAMWTYLDHPRQSFFFGSYSSFLDYSVPSKLNAENLPAALAWCQQRHVDDIGPIAELAGTIFALAVEHIEAPGVAIPLAEAVLQRCRSYHGFPGRRHSKEKSTVDVLHEDDARRRAFLSAFLSLLKKENEFFLLHPLSMLNGKDLKWFIERIETGVSPDPVLEARLVNRLAGSWEYEAVCTVWEACERNETLAAECGGLFRPVPLEEGQQWKTPSRADFLREHNLTEAPPMPPRIEAALAKSESGEADEWLQLLQEMAIEEGETHRRDFRSMKPTELPGWFSSSDESKQRIVRAAKRYLLETTFPELDAAPMNGARQGASAGINALWMLQEVEPDFLKTQPPEFWLRWIPSFTEDGRAGDDKHEAINAVFTLAASSAPDAMSQHLLDVIDFENAGEQKFLFCSRLLDRAWSPLFGEALFNKVQDDTLSPPVQSSLLMKLLSNDVPEARNWAEEAIRADHASERGLALARVLLGADEDLAWPVLWPVIQADTEFGRALLENFSYGNPDRHAFGKSFNEKRLEELYIWLAEQYPHDNDRRASGALGSVDTIRFLRDGTLEVLKQRGTFEACDSLTRIELYFPRAKWMRLHYDAAEVLACAVTWEPPAPKTILAMGKDRSKRFVESSAQLLEAILNSLGRLQAELHGELGSVGELWNNDGNEWWPKQEEDVSDHIARFLRRDLIDRGIVVNREVQIRRGKKGEMPGQDTDIHVDAVVLKTMPQSHYGTVGIVIEVKGTWNDGLLTDMEVQLRDRYLRNSGCRTGLYVAAHFEADAWREKDRRLPKSNRWNIDELRALLKEQANALSGGVDIRSFVLDVSLDSTKASGIKAPG